MLDVARYQVRPIVSLSQDHIVKHNVLWVGEHDSTWRSIDIQAVLQQLGNNSLYGLLLQIEFRTRKNFLVFGKNLIVHKCANATRKNSLNNLQYGRFRRFGNQSGHNDISVNDCINHEPPRLSYLPARQAAISASISASLMPAAGPRWACLRNSMKALHPGLAS